MYFHNLRIKIVTGRSAEDSMQGINALKTQQGCEGWRYEILAFGLYKCLGILSNPAS